MDQKGLFDLKISQNGGITASNKKNDLFDWMGMNEEILSRPISNLELWFFPEFMLLYKMASFPGKIFTRQQLMDDIWGYESDTDTHTIDVHIGRLRDKYGDNKDFKIVTIRGVGYKVVKL